MQAPEWIRPNWPFADPEEQRENPQEAREQEDPNVEGFGRGSWSQRHTLNLKGVLKELAIELAIEENKQSAKKRRVS